MRNLCTRKVCRSRGIGQSKAKRRQLGITRSARRDTRCDARPRAKADVHCLRSGWQSKGNEAKRDQAAAPKKRESCRVSFFRLYNVMHPKTRRGAKERKRAQKSARARELPTRESARAATLLMLESV